MTSRQLASKLRMQAHVLMSTLKKIENSDTIAIESELLMKFTVKILEQFAKDKVAQAQMLESLAEHLDGFQFDLLSECTDLTPLGQPPLDI